MVQGERVVKRKGCGVSLQRRASLFLLCLAVLFLAAGCETWHGLGRDIKNLKKVDQQFEDNFW
jgi:predicted small secreted protein